MALPQENQPEALARSESVQLFIDRAQSVTPNLEWQLDSLLHIARICRLVEGMPLGIELAATWMDTLSPCEISDEIEHNLDILEAQRADIPDSQRSIRAAFDRSWKLLDDEQQAAFRRLSVFRGGFTREAGEAVTGVRLRTLQALVNKSLLRRNPHTGRYEFHELLRHFAEEQLEASSEAGQVCQAHAAYFADFMDERWSWMKDQRQARAVQEVEADMENVRAAWQTCIDVGDVSRLNRFLHTLWAVYDIRGWYLAGIDLFEQAIAVMRSIATDEARAGLGWLLAVQGLFRVSGEILHASTTPAPAWMTEFGIYIVRADARCGYELAREGVDILKQLNPCSPMLIIPLMSLFITSCQLDEEGAPLQTAQDCLEIATRIGDPWAVAKAKQLLSVQAIGDEDCEGADRLAQEALATFDASGDNWSKSVLCIEVLGLLAIRQRQFESAKNWMQRGLKAAETIDFKCAMQIAYWQLGFVATLEENYAESALYWRKALEVAEQILGGATFLGFGGSRDLASATTANQPLDESSRQE
jgi:tetratricopeptide (TPR) repeat protein